MADSDDEDAFASADEDTVEDPVPITKAAEASKSEDLSTKAESVKKSDLNKEENISKVNEESNTEKEVKESRPNKKDLENKQESKKETKTSEKEKEIKKESEENLNVDSRGGKKKEVIEKKNKGKDNKGRGQKSTSAKEEPKKGKQETQKVEPDTNPEKVEEKVEEKVGNTKESKDEKKGETKSSDAKLKDEIKDDSKTVETKSSEESQSSKEHESVSYRTRQISQGMPDEPTEGTTNNARDPRSALERLTASKEGEGSGGGWGWGGWSSWGSSVLNSATSSVNTFSNQVGAGISQVLHTVESGFNDQTEEIEMSAGDKPETKDQPTEKREEEVITKQIDKTSLAEAASSVSQSEHRAESNEEKSMDGDGWFASWGLSVVGEVVSKTTNVVQSTVQQTTSASKKVVSGGLDVLETIGKKTFDILTEGDHGLKKVIENSRNKPNLSQTLREAKDVADKQAKEEESYADARKTNFSALFDDHHGLVQLEALEMLSSNSEGRLKKVLEVIPDSDSESIRSQLIEIKMLFNKVTADETEEDVPGGQSFKDLIMDYKGRMSLTVDTQKLLNAHENAESWLNEFKDVQKSEKPHVPTVTDIHIKSIECLASLTAATVEHFHKSSQLLLQNDFTSSASCNTVTVCLTDLTVGVCREVGRLTSKFVECLMSMSDSSKESVTEVITSIYLESGNSTTYIKDAFHLLLPVLQLSTVRAHPSCKDIVDN